MVRVRARVRSSFGKRRQLPEWFSRARPRSHAVPQLPTGGASKSALGLAARERNPSGALSVAHGLFTRVRRRGFLRSSSLRSSRKFGYEDPLGESRLWVKAGRPAVL